MIEIVVLSDDFSLLGEAGYIKLICLCYNINMRKFKLKFFAINLIAAAAIGLSAFLPWFAGLIPKDISLSQVLPFDLPSQVSNMYLSAAAIVLFGASFIFVGSIFSLRSMVIFGILLNVSLVVFWLLNLGFELETYEGIGLLCAGLMLSFLSLFIRRRSRENKK